MNNNDKVSFLIAHNRLINVYNEKVDFAHLCYQVFDWLFFIKIFGNSIEDLQLTWQNSIHKHRN